MKKRTLISAIFIGILLGGMISTVYISAISWPNIRGNVAINSLDGSMMDLFNKILTDTGASTTGKVKNTQKLNGLLESNYQRRIVNDAATCVETTDSIVEIQPNGSAICRSRLPWVCWTASWSSFTNVPSTNLCFTGSIPSPINDLSVPVYPNSWPYTWTCSRWTTVNCQAESAWRCNSAFVWRCDSGTPTSVNTIPNSPSHCWTVRDYHWWDCRWSDGSSDRCSRCN